MQPLTDPQTDAIPRPLFQVTSLRHTYHQEPVLQIDRFGIFERSIIGLVGPNGSGKSTFLKLLAFTEKPTFGEIRFNGEPAGPFSENVRFKVTLLTQEPYLLRRTVDENVRYGLKLRGLKNADSDRKIDQALEWVGLTSERIKHRQWHELSGGEIQRVALAARLVLKPAALLLDEPTANVDAESAELIRHAVLKAREEWGTTLVIASHDWAWLYEICDTVRQLYRGKIFNAHQENPISGPWHHPAEGNWNRSLENGQCLRVPEPPAPDAAALFSFTPLPALPEQNRKSGVHYVKGVITRLIFDRNRKDLIVVVAVGNLSLFAGCPRDRIREWNRIPGDSLILAYEINRVKWI